MNLPPLSNKYPRRRLKLERRSRQNRLQRPPPSSRRRPRQGARPPRRLRSARVAQHDFVVRSRLWAHREPAAATPSTQACCKEMMPTTLDEDELQGRHARVPLYRLIPDCSTLLFYSGGSHLLRLTRFSSLPHLTIVPRCILQVFACSRSGFPGMGGPEV